MFDANAYALILDFEVGGGEAYYNNHLAFPSVPGEDSGITIGVGYDLGYVSVTEFQCDWTAHLSENNFDKLIAVCGLIKERARAQLDSVKDIIIPWKSAETVFRTRTLPRFEQITRKTFPGVEKLPPPVYGALVSLVFNRGGSLSGERRAEMREIAELVKAKDIVGIAMQLRKMKRLWVGHGVDGLLARREAEARLIESAATRPINIA